MKRDNLNQDFLCKETAPPTFRSKVQRANHYITAPQPMSSMQDLLNQWKLPTFPSSYCVEPFFFAPRIKYHSMIGSNSVRAFSTQTPLLPTARVLNWKQVNEVMMTLDCRYSTCVCE